jgi:type VI secretion system protein ImpK
MAEQSKQGFDPDATVAQPAPAADPDATVSQPVPLDPDATVTMPGVAIDPEATVSGPLARSGDPEATDRQPAFDPDATDRRPAFDPDATVRVPTPGRQRANPFAPKAPPETLQANLGALGGLNTLAALANPILAAVPQIRRTLRHPDPAGLRDSLREQIESLEMSAVSAEVPDDTVSAAVYALCALLDESAAATPWGRDWAAQGLLNTMRGEGNAAEGFFAELDKAMAEPEKNAELLEFLYICLALGFEGRYRALEGGRVALDQVKDRLYAQIARRRPRPEALSVRWRTPAAQAVADAALATAARATAARAAADAAAKAAEQQPAAAPAPAGFALSRLPRRAIWSAVAGIVGAAIVFYMLALRLLEDETRNATASRPGLRAKNAAAVPAAPVPALAAVSAALAGLPVSVTAAPDGVAIALDNAHQFGPGSPRPSGEARALLGRIARALDKVPGAIVVAGYADASPAGAHYASNADLSAARARSAAQVMAPLLGDPKRLSSEGRGDADPVAPNDSDEGRARNRRVTILVRPAP